MKQKLCMLLRSEVLRNPARRAMLTAHLSFALNTLYALYHGVLGVTGRSLWFLNLCVFYALLALMRLSVLLCHRASKSAAYESLVPRFAGALLILLSLILIVVMYISQSQSLATRHGEIVMISIAAYTFTKLGIAISSAIRQRNDPDVLRMTLRRIRYAEVAASVLTLQRSMLVSFGTMEPQNILLMNALTGGAVCLFVFLLGVSMAFRRNK